MKNASMYLAIAAVFVFAIGVPATEGAFFDWAGATQGTGDLVTQRWHQDDNWSGTGYPNGAGDVADMAIDRTNFLAIRIHQDVTIGEIIVGDTNGNSPMVVYYQPHSPTNPTSNEDYLTFEASSGSAKITKAAGTGGSDQVASWSMGKVYLNSDLIVDNQSTSGSVELRAYDMTGSGGITKTGPGNLIMGNASNHNVPWDTVNTYLGDTRVEEGVMRMESASALPDTTTVWIADGAAMDLGFTGSDTITSLYLGGVGMTDIGTYGATGSGADYIYDDYFTGSGTLNVITAASAGSVAPLLLISGGLLFMVRRKSRRS